MSRSRNFIFQYYNYPHTHILDQLDCKYIIYNHYTSESGQPYVEGYIAYENYIGLRALQLYLSMMSVQVANQDSWHYISKHRQGTFTEHGTIECRVKCGDKKKLRWSDILEVIQLKREEELNDQKYNYWRDQIDSAIHTFNQLNYQEEEDTDIDEIS